ncbi:nitrile hydratase subunit beta [Salaquimonas pukyongi]|uniref:nitrile hydratase subunit beta n=1 Tax=Salaquimonas pukyongi TaxID=2712698 RepID=UPI00096B9AB8|nr:nitrile hydratase subunit beta [Salaquimonas pukyongi]
MNGPHDMGGMQCYGPVEPEIDEPVFHGEWEKRALAITVAMGAAGMWNLDQSRFARENLPPVAYLSSSYYQIWLAGLESLMKARGMVNGAELESGKLEISAVQTKRPAPDRAAMGVALAAGGPVSRETSTQPAFAPGEPIVARNHHPQGHTRLPRYVRGRPGIIAAVQGFHVFPDANADGQGEDPHWLYSVAFRARDLFGAGSHEVFVDCWEPYLERAVE